jgi:hypothetical protein
LNDKFTLCLGKKIRSLSEAEVPGFFLNDLDLLSIALLLCLILVLCVLQPPFDFAQGKPSTSLRVNLRLRSGNKKIRSLSEAEVPDFFE